MWDRGRYGDANMKTPLIKRLKYYVGLGFASLLVFSGLFSLAPVSQKAVAAPASGSWASSTSIRYNGQTFSGPSQNGSNGFIRYTSTTAVNCVDSNGNNTKRWDYIEFRNNPTEGTNPASPGFYDEWDKSEGAICKKISSNFSVALTSPERAKQTQAQGECASRPFNEQAACVQAAAERICANSGTGFDACVAAQKAAVPATGVTPGQSADNSGGELATEQDPELDCSVTWNPTTWIVCPFIKLINATLYGLDNAIVGLLTVEQDKIFDDSKAPGQGYYEAWKAFRGIALGLLVAGALIMIISQALGFDFLDAYTIKKILPRLVVAIIGISLSWEIMRWFVVFTNDLGLGIRQIIYYPFLTGLGATSGNSEIIEGGESMIIFLLSGGAMLGLGLMGILSFGLTALLALFVAFLVLVLRQLIIVVLVLFAPIAIAAYILPNTQSIWKLWYESFTKALMMFPIIMAFLAVGRIIAMTSSTDDATFVGQLVAFVAYIIPYFLIPLTFRFAGGALRTLGGFVNDKGRGGFDRLKKFRQGQVSKNMSAMKHGNRFQSENWAANKFNRTTGNIAAIPHAGWNPKQMKSRMKAHQSNESMLEAAEYSEKNHAFQAIKQNDDFLQAAIHGKGKDENVRKYLQDINAKSIAKGGPEIYSDAAIDQGVATIRAARRDASPEVFDTAAALALPATGTAFKGGAGEMHDLINEVAGNDRVKAGRMLAAMRGGASSARRFDLAGGGFGSQMGVMENQFKHSQDPTKGLSTQQASQQIFEESLEGQGGAYVAGGRKTAVQNLAPVMLKQIGKQLRTGDEQGVARELAALAGRHDAMASVAPENARVLADETFGEAIDVNTLRPQMRVLLDNAINVRDANGKVTGTKATITVREAMDSLRGNNDFQNMRREYQMAGMNAAQAQQMGAAAQAALQAQGGGPQKPPVPPVMGAPGT